MSVAENLQSILNSIPPHVTLVAVSKTYHSSVIMEAYNAGHRIFGENKVQELVEKKEQMPDDVQWHLIGHLQTNKVKYIAPFVSLIHAVDSVKLLKEINKEGKKNNRVIPCLLQVHIAEEESKFGFSYDECEEVLSLPLSTNFPNVQVCGLMGMATNTEDQQQVRNEFKNLHLFYIRYKELAKLDVLSMGMSGDYKIAMEEGSTMVRIGSAIFGSRQ